MNATVVDVQWHDGFPVGTIIEAETGRRYQTGLVHRAFVCRHQIGPGAEVVVSHDGTSIVQTLRPGTVWGEPPSGDSVSGRWVRFRGTLQPYLTRRTAMALFRSGIQTLSDLLHTRDDTLRAVPGIGPASTRVIRAFIDRSRSDESAVV